MKLFILSDIHGSFKALEKALDAYNRDDYSMILLLGDSLYHGPGKTISHGYNRGKTIELLNSVRGKIIAVRGNCDSEVDQVVLGFSNMSDYHIVIDGGRKIFLTHGHIYNSSNLPPLNRGDIFASGHSHVATIKEEGGVIHFNPGSISLPRENTLPSYGIYDGKTLKIISLEGDLLEYYNF